MPSGSPSSSTVPVDVPATAIGVSSSTTTLTVPVAVTVSPSPVGRLHQAAEVDRQVVLGVGAAVAWSSGLTSVNVHAPVDASSAIVNTVLPAPAVAVIRFAADRVGQRNVARRQAARQRYPPC